MPDISPAARDRAVQTLIAAAVFGDSVQHILGAIAELEGETVVVATVNAVEGDFRLTGVHYVERLQLVEVVPRLEGADGWAMVFSEGTGAADVARRCEEMALLAEKRIAALDRLAAKRAGPGLNT